jgi:hypothetical protein
MVGEERRMRCKCDRCFADWAGASGVIGLKRFISDSLISNGYRKCRNISLRVLIVLLGVRYASSVYAPETVAT